MLQRFTYALIISFIIWTTLSIITNPPPKTTMKHYDIMSNIEPFTFLGTISQVINHEKVIWENSELSLELFLIGIYVPTGFRTEAKDFLTTNLLGKKAKLELDKQYRDRFGNYYGYIYLEDEMINGLLIKKGLAKSALVPPNDRYTARFLQWEIDAKKNGVGIWFRNKKDNQRPQIRNNNVL